MDIFLSLAYHVANFMIGIAGIVAMVVAVGGLVWVSGNLIPGDQFRTDEDGIRFTIVGIVIAASAFVAASILHGRVDGWSYEVATHWQFSGIFEKPMSPYVYFALNVPNTIDVARNTLMIPAIVGALVVVNDFVINPLTSLFTRR